MNKLLALFSALTLIAAFVFGILWWQQKSQSADFVNPLGSLVPTPIPAKPLLSYSFESLKNYTPQASTIKIEGELSHEDEYRSHIFSFTTGNKRMTGEISIPQADPPPGGYPVIVMIRGYAPLSSYTTGVGTKNAAHFYASHGFVTLAPDFLGYGDSDAPATDTIEARLERPGAVLDLMASLSSLSFVDTQKMFLWGHSNGGQIALSILQITGKPIPTTLWAPVSKGFPYSILYYTDESPDQGKALRKVLADFEKQYDTFDFSIDRYWEWITAPVQVHQGTADDAIPLEWTNQLVKNLEAQSLPVTYFIYPGADHNLRPGWDTVVQRDLSFFRQHLP